MAHFIYHITCLNLGLEHDVFQEYLKIFSIHFIYGHTYSLANIFICY